MNTEGTETVSCLFGLQRETTRREKYRRGTVQYVTFYEEKVRVVPSVPPSTDDGCMVFAVRTATV